MHPPKLYPPFHLKIGTKMVFKGNLSFLRCVIIKENDCFALGEWAFNFRCSQSFQSLLQKSNKMTSLYYKISRQPRQILGRKFAELSFIDTFSRFLINFPKIFTLQCWFCSPRDFLINSTRQFLFWILNFSMTLVGSWKKKLPVKRSLATLRQRSSDKTRRSKFVENLLREKMSVCASKSLGNC